MTVNQKSENNGSQAEKPLPVALISLNAKYIHSNLALDYLRAYCEKENLPVDMYLREFHINQPVDFIVGEILTLNPVVVAFSCYIWNITETLHVISRLKRIRPKTVVIIGGPEVSYEPEEVMDSHPEIDYCICGEGEEVFARLLGALARSYADAGRQDLLSKRIITADPVDLAHVPSPYPANLQERYKNKLVYIETSRGCPFSCQYCLSSRSRGVRYFPWERVCREFVRFIEAEIPQVKVIDRTFNADPRRALRLFRFLVEASTRRQKARGESQPKTVFHFEIAADLLQEELLQYLETVPAGLFQFEIGVQSTTPEVLAAVRRKSNWPALKRAVERLARAGNIHLHLDLIAGLPKETYASFAQSFNDVFHLGAHRIQLGFLKLLKGSGLRQRSQELGLVYDKYPPYEILATPTLSATDLWHLKGIESLVEQYYNSHRFWLTLQLLCYKVYSSPFAFFEDFAAFWHREGLHRVAHNSMVLYDILYRFIDRHHSDIRQLAAETLKFDYLRREPHRHLRKWMPEKMGEQVKTTLNRLLRKPQVLRQLDPELASHQPRELQKVLRLGSFSPQFIIFLRESLAAQRGPEISNQFEGPGPNSVQAGSAQPESNAARGGEEKQRLILFDYNRQDCWTKESAFYLLP